MATQGPWSVMEAELTVTVLWEWRWGWVGAFWFVCEIGFQHSQGWQRRNARNILTLFRARRPAIPLSSYAKKKVCLRWLLQKSFACSFCVKSHENCGNSRYDRTVSLIHHKMPIFLLEQSVLDRSVLAPGNNRSAGSSLIRACQSVMEIRISHSKEWSKHRYLIQNPNI